MLPRSQINGLDNLPRSIAMPKAVRLCPQYNGKIIAVTHNKRKEAARARGKNK